MNLGNFNFKRGFLRIYIVVCISFSLLLCFIFIKEKVYKIEYLPQDYKIERDARLEELRQNMKIDNIKHKKYYLEQIDLCFEKYEKLKEKKINLKGFVMGFVVLLFFWTIIGGVPILLYIVLKWIIDGFKHN